MSVRAVVHHVHDVQGFVASYLSDPDNPDPATYTPMVDARATLEIALAGLFSFSFFPSFALKSESDDDGSLHYDVPDFIPESWDARLIIFEQIDAVEVWGFTIPIFAPVYRSASFRMEDGLGADAASIYVACPEAPPSAGISQSAVSEAARNAAGDMEDVDDIVAFIRSNHIDVTIKGRADVKFDLKLRPSTRADLDDFVDHEIENMDIDLPGWDFLTQLCADEDDIRRRVRRGVADLVDGFNEDVISALVGEIAERTDIDDSLIRSYLDSQATITLRSIRFPITDERTIGPFTLSTRSIVASPCIGFPRNLYE